MTIHTPVRIGPAETTLIEQLGSVGATAAAERLAVIGLPTRKVENYHYTDLKMLLRAVPELALTTIATSEPALRIPGPHIVVSTVWLRTPVLGVGGTVDLLRTISGWLLPFSTYALWVAWWWEMW